MQRPHFLAGLHFSRHLLKRLEIKGINFAEVTLHVGLGTFNSVEVEDLSKHNMDSEEIKIPASTATTINKALVEKRRICAVGTTAMRTIESSVAMVTSEQQQFLVQELTHLE